MFEIAKQVITEPSAFVPRRSERLRIKREMKLFKDQCNATQLRVDQLRAEQLRAKQQRAKQQRAKQQRAKQQCAKQQRAKQQRAKKQRTNQRCVLPRRVKQAVNQIVQPAGIKRKRNDELLELTKPIPYSLGTSMWACICLEVDGTLVKLYDLPSVKRQKIG